MTKFRYLLIVFLLIFFLTNFIFVKKSLASCAPDLAAEIGQLCTGSGNTINLLSGETISNKTGIKLGATGTDSLTINNYGTVTGTYSSAIIYYHNSVGSSSGTINNYGTIQGTGATAYAITNEVSLLTINNTGTISSIYGSAINNFYGASLTIDNSGTISSSGSGSDYLGTVYSWDTNASTLNLTNRSGGTISSTGNGSSAIVVERGAANITNYGTITAAGTGYAHGIYNSWIGTISNISNFGTITSARGYGIYSESGATITTLNNSQVSLTYYGKLPQNYNIILGSNASTFGTLVVTNPSNYDGSSGKTTFGINSGAVKANKYAGVISGLSTSYLSSQTGTYSGYDWTLSLQSGSSTVWDLLFVSYVDGPSSADTDASLLTVASNLKGVINYQNSSLNHSLNYDCSYFGKSNSCMSSSVRNSNTKDNDSQSVAIIGSTKIGDHVRVGGFIDGTVNKDHNFNMKLNSNSPMFGAFTRFNQYDQNFGLKGGVSAGYINQDLKSTRVVTGTSEPGTGTSNLTTKGIQAEIQYGIDATSFLTVSPYVGYRNTQTTRDKYTEETSSTVTTPLTYNKIKQTEETAFVGIELKSHFHTTDKFATLNLGYEHAAKFSIDNLSTSGVSGTSDVNLGSNIDKTRPIIMASLNQDLGTSGRLSLNFDRRQQVYSPTNSTNVALQYAVGF